MIQVVELDALFTLAELAITMIGVAGLVAVFLSKGGLKAANERLQAKAKVSAVG